MIHISNLRIESVDGWTKLVADFTCDEEGVLPSFEPVIWLAVKDENAHMLASDVYDAFLLIPLYIAMYYKQDLYIHGYVSKKLYKNVMNYLQRILCDFSDDLFPVNIIVDGFKVAEGEPNIIGTGLSCGVDSLSTVYDRYVKEDNLDCKVNALFFLDTGWHGDFYEKQSRDLCIERYNVNKRAANELGLPIHLVITNFHAFTYKLYYGISGQMGHFANYSCFLGLQRAIKKYYVSNSLSYSQILRFGINYKEKEFAEFSESYSVPLIQTEKLELVIDGCQYERTQKIERLADWYIAQKYMTPCSRRSYKSRVFHVNNCSSCIKCMQVMMVLEAIGKIDKFSAIFNISEYKKHLRYEKARVVCAYFMGMTGGEPDIYVFLKKHGVRLPSLPIALVYLIPMFIKKLVRMVLGKKIHDRLRKSLGRYR